MQKCKSGAIEILNDVELSPIQIEVRQFRAKGYSLKHTNWGSGSTRKENQVRKSDKLKVKSKKPVTGWNSTM
jgi:hypothetical protein